MGHTVHDVKRLSLAEFQALRDGWNRQHATGEEKEPMSDAAVAEMSRFLDAEMRKR